MKKAVTLVELLIVIGILGILIGVLLSTFGGAGESARATKCLANLRSLAMATQSYAMGHSGSYPTAAGWISTQSKDKDAGYISPYDTNIELRQFSLTNGTLWAAINRSSDCYFCPSHKVYAREHNLGGEPLWSYAMNGSLSGSYGSVDRADRTLLFGELAFSKIESGEFKQTGSLSEDELDPILNHRTAGKYAGEESIGFNHKIGKNYYAHICFADGHVEKLVAPKKGDVAELTSWLCKPTDDKIGDFDVVLQDGEYKQSDATK